MLTYIVYVLYSEKLDQFHLNSTWDGINEELKKHNTGGKHQTTKGVPWILIWYGEFPAREGVDFISKLKKMSRSRFIRAFRKANGNYPGEGQHPNR